MMPTEKEAKLSESLARTIDEYQQLKARYERLRKVAEEARIVMLGNDVRYLPFEEALTESEGE